MKFSGAILAVAAVMAISSTANAQATVDQADRKFSTADVTVKRGGSVTFANKDRFTHNVFSSTPGMAFDLRTQKPGESSEIKFDNAGTADVQCAIHPNMKMKVRVE